MINEKGVSNQMKMENLFKSNGFSVHNSNKIFNVKRKLTLNNERSIERSVGGTFSKFILAIRLAKDTNCTYGKYKGFIRLYESRRKNVNVVNIQLVSTTNFRIIPQINRRAITIS